jgi:aryl-alcohol dehydrogenase-like predicted oxidoreductase
MAGASSAAQLEENLEAVDPERNEEERARLAAAQRWR